jgi:hypothetical protein
MLMASSYPHATLANLTLELSRMGGVEKGELERVSEELRDMERSFDMMDFIRCVEIKRNQERVTVVVKRLKITPSMQTIKDTQLHHEPLTSSNIDVGEGLVLADTEAMAKTLLDAFHRTQVKQPAVGRAIEQSLWVQRRKDPDSSAVSPEGACNKFIDLKIDFSQAGTLIKASLDKDKFHLILTQDTILLLDQETRLWLVEAEAPAP